MTGKSYRDEVRALGSGINPQVIGASIEIYGRYQAGPRDDTVSIERDIAYGPHERHRLDIFTGVSGGDRPVLIYVHGGGFVGGDKVLPGTPFYDNFGIWAAQQGFVGVTMTYRLAPDHSWPAGAEDVGSAIAWLRANIAAHGGAPGKIFLAGQSAGGAHVAGYLALPRLHDVTPPLAGAMMFSGIYEPPSALSPPDSLYFRDEPGREVTQAALDGLIASEVPMLFTVAEHDGPAFQKQAALLVERWFAAKQAMPRLICLPDANHMTAALSIGGVDRLLGPEIAAFVERFSRP